MKQGRTRQEASQGDLFGEPVAQGALAVARPAPTPGEAEPAPLVPVSSEPVVAPKAEAAPAAVEVIRVELEERRVAAAVRPPAFQAVEAGSMGVEIRLPGPRAPERPPERGRDAGAEAVSDAPGRAVWTVGDLTRAIKDTLARGFSRVLVRGEVSGFRGANARGHLYFSLKDAEACLDAKVWVSVAQRMKFKLREGMSVVAEGYIDLYAPQGRYSLIVHRLEPLGEGALALAFQQLKERLTAEGLMGEHRLRPPRPLPSLPRRIGVVTSRSGAALQDFLRVLHARHPRLSVLICHAKVQGEGSAEEVVSALERLARTDVDVIVVTRGGGSVEDLWTFNEETVARAIHACPVPVVSAIGHEVDFTIADFVADFRAPTPSAAAERLAPVLRELELGLATAEGRLAQAMARRVLEARQELTDAARRLPDPRRALGEARLRLGDDTDRLARRMGQLLKGRREALKGLQERLQRQQPQARLSANRHQLSKLRERLVKAMLQRLAERRAKEARARLALERQSPARRVQAERERLMALAARVTQGGRRSVAERQGHFQGVAARLDAMSPLKVMSRGYAVAFRRADGHLVRSAGDVQVGEGLALKLAPPAAGTLSDCEEIEATVTSVRRKASR